MTPRTLGVVTAALVSVVAAGWSTALHVRAVRAQAAKAMPESWCPPGWHRVCGHCARWCPRYSGLSFIIPHGEALGGACWVDVSGVAAGRGGSTGLFGTTRDADAACGESASWAVKP